LHYQSDSIDTPQCFSSSHFLSLEIIQLAFSALMLLVGWQEGHPACKILEWWVLAWLSVWGQVRFAYGSADTTATHYLLLQ